MICVAVTIGYIAGGAGRNYGRPWIIPRADSYSPAVRCRWRWRCMADPYYIGLAVLLRAVLHRPEADHRPQPAADLRQGADVAREREAALAGQFDTALNNMPHGLCMFARRRPACRHESSLQRNDEPVRRSRAARRQRARHHRGLRQRRIDLGGERQDDPFGNREYAGEGHHHHRSRRRQRPVAVLDVPADGRRRRGRAAGRHHRAAQRGSQDQSSGALRRTDGASQPGQFPRRDRASAGDTARCRAVVGVAVRRPRPVQAGQRHARSSLRRPAVVRGRRPAARDAAARRISWRASAATNSWCSSRTSNRTTTPPVSPGASSSV